MKKILFGSAIGLASTVGYLIGVSHAMKTFNNDLRRKENLRIKVVADTIMRARKQEMTEREIIAELRTGLEFVNQVMG